MRVKVLYFAFLRDEMGRAGESLELPDAVKTVAGLRAFLIGQGDPWAHAFQTVKRIRASVNQVMVEDDAAVAEGDEVAFFPPVTGG